MKAKYKRIYFSLVISFYTYFISICTHLSSANDSFIFNIFLQYSTEMMVERMKFIIISYETLYFMWIFLHLNDLFMDDCTVSSFFSVPLVEKHVSVGQAYVLSVAAVVTLYARTMRDSNTYFACFEFKVQLTYFWKVLQLYDLKYYII